MSDLRLHFSNRQQADHPLFPGVHRVLRQPSGVLGIGDGLSGVLLAQVCLDRRGLLGVAAEHQRQQARHVDRVLIFGGPVDEALWWGGLDELFETPAQLCGRVQILRQGPVIEADEHPGLDLLEAGVAARMRHDDASDAVGCSCCQPRVQAQAITGHYSLNCP